MLVKRADVHCASIYTNTFYSIRTYLIGSVSTLFFQSDAEQEAEKDDAPASPASPSGE